jgi:hypothetical protein
MHAVRIAEMIMQEIGNYHPEMQVGGATVAVPAGADAVSAPALAGADAQMAAEPEVAAATMSDATLDANDGQMDTD